MTKQTKITKQTKALLRMWRVPAFVCFVIFVCFAISFVFAQQDEMWSNATPPYNFDFARDQANHPDYRIEQWSYSGDLSSANGRRFGYQYKFIRAGVSFKPENPSRWAVRNLFITQLAVTDINGKQFKTAERINRAGVGWAGVSSEDLHLWNDDWEVRQNTLLAAEGELGLELSFDAGRPAMAHGMDGVFQKGLLAFNASHFYSITRMATRGALLLDGQRIEVTGASRMDHEFGNSFLEEGQRGWDWFAIELEDGTDLMIYQLRLADGTRDDYSIATLVRADGTRESLRSEDFELEPLARWTSTASAGNYPIRWRVKIPSKQIEIEVSATVEDQELRAAQSIGVTYWRGGVDVKGTRNSSPVKGRGALEMTGYSPLESLR